MIEELFSTGSDAVDLEFAHTLSSRFNDEQQYLGKRKVCHQNHKKYYFNALQNRVNKNIKDEVWL